MITHGDTSSIGREIGCDLTSPTAGDERREPIVLTALLRPVARLAVWWTAGGASWRQGWSGVAWHPSTHDVPIRAFMTFGQFLSSAGTVPATVVPASVTQTAAWFTLAGGLVGAAGSAVRAWFALKEYEDLVHQSEVPALLKAALKTARQPLPLGSLLSLLFAVGTAVMVLLWAPVITFRKGLTGTGAWLASRGTDIWAQVKKDVLKLPPVTLFRT